MYNLSGIFYRLWAVSGLFLFFAGIAFLLSRFWNRKKRDMKGIVVGICLLLVAFTSGFRYAKAAINPEIQIHEGYFLYKNRDSRVAPPLPFTTKYVFSNSTKGNPAFYLDTFSKKEICPQGFDENLLYRIYYEESTKIIVSVEILEPEGD